MKREPWMETMEELVKAIAKKQKNERKQAAGSKLRAKNPKPQRKKTRTVRAWAYESRYGRILLISTRKATVKNWFSQERPYVDWKEGFDINDYIFEGTFHYTPRSAAL